MSQAVEAYRGITATEEFKYLESIRVKTQHDEAQALSNARRLEREKWQGALAEKDAVLAEQYAVLADKDAVLANKDAALAEQAALIAELRSQLNKI